jgi:hypothetical protein
MGNGTRYVDRASSVVEFVAGLEDQRPVPATPAWDVHDLIAHVAGVAVDVVRHNVDAYAQPSWTTLQVTSRAHRSRESLIAEWRDTWPDLSQILDDPVACGFDALFAVLPLADLLAHEHDLRESAGLFDFADADVWPAIEQRRRDVLTAQCNSAGCCLEIDTPEGDHWVLGSASQHLRVTADRYELWRSLEGRRPRTAVRAFDWDQDPEPFLDAWVGSVFHWPEDNLP